MINKNTFKNCTSLKDISVPSGITAIGESAFENCHSLTSITIPENITSIKPYTFVNCTSLTDIVIPNKIKSIDVYSFYGCKSLQKFNIPESIETINDFALYGLNSVKTLSIPASVNVLGKASLASCQSLETILVNEKNKNYISIDGVLFNKNKTTLIQYPNGNKRSKYTIPGGTQILGEYSFWGANKLETIIIPSSISTLKNYTFQEMSSLKEIRYEGTKEPKCEEKTFIDTKINKVSVPLQYESRDFCNIQAMKDELKNSVKKIMILLCLILLIIF